MPGSWEERDAGSGKEQSGQNAGQWSELDVNLTNPEGFGERTRNNFSQEIMLQVRSRTVALINARRKMERKTHIPHFT